MKYQKRFATVLLAIAAGLVFAACDTEKPAEKSTGNKQQAGRRGGSLVYRITTPVTTLNYFLAKDEPSIVATLFLLNDRLVVLDHEKQVYVPLLAESYTTAADGRTVDIVLRDGLKFSDGKPLTTADVAFTLAAVYDKRTESPIFRDSLLVDDKEIETKIADERRMQFIFPEQVASVENYLENLVVLPKHILDADYQAGKLSETWKITSDPQSIVTSGPFLVDSVQTGERVSLKRNPHYWKKDAAGIQLPYLDTLVLEVVSDANNAFARLTQNTLDVADRIRTTDYAALKSGGGAVVPHDLGPGLASDHIWFNLNRTNGKGEALDKTPKYRWFDDKRFRRAVAHAIDRNSIATNTLQGLATPVFGFVPAGNRVWLDTALPKIDYDLEKSRALLTEAGFTQRDNAGKPELFDAANNRVEFTLIVPAENEPRKLMAAVIQEDLAQLGINMQVAPIENQGITERWSKTFEYDAVLMGQALTGIDPSSFASFLTSGGTVHQWQPKQVSPSTEWEARIDTLFAQQAKEPDQNTRKQIFNEIQAILAEETPIIPIVSRHIVSGANSKIGNYAPSSFLPYSLWNADSLFIKE
jgi:peptide/nickel transport system substrate-binding protein